jgi:hypothetical protein
MEIRFGAVGICGGVFGLDHFPSDFGWLEFLWFVIGHVPDFSFCLWSIHKLSQDLRLVAAQRFQATALSHLKVAVGRTQNRASSLREERWQWLAAFCLSACFSNLQSVGVRFGKVRDIAYLA